MEVTRTQDNRVETRKPADNKCQVNDEDEVEVERRLDKIG